jgi:hypothetical protein
MADGSVVAWWGAGLSSILGAVNLYDRFFRKPVPSVSYMFSSLEDIGNELVIANPSSVPMLIQHWELFYGRVTGLDLLKRLPMHDSYEDSLGISVLKPHEWLHWHFTQENAFLWGGRAVPYGQLYLSLQFVGRSQPVVVFVYDPASNNGAQEPWSARRLLPHAIRPAPIKAADYGTWIKAPD